MHCLREFDWNRPRAGPARVSQQSHRVAAAVTVVALLLVNRLLQLSDNQQLIKKQALAVNLQLIKQDPNWEHY